MIVISQEDLIRVLHVDDDPDHLMISKRYLEKYDSAIQVVSVSSPKEALQKAETFDCVVSDYQMPGMNGIELARRIREKTDTPIIIYTGKGSEEVASSAFEAGIDDYLKRNSNTATTRCLRSVSGWPWRGTELK